MRPSGQLIQYNSAKKQKQTAADMAFACGEGQCEKSKMLSPSLHVIVDNKTLSEETSHLKRNSLQKKPCRKI